MTLPHKWGLSHLLIIFFFLFVHCHYSYSEEISDEFKLGQLIQVQLLKEDINKTLEIIKKYHVGSIIFYRQPDLKKSIETFNLLQQTSLEYTHAPLIFASDFEAGAAYNMKECATVYPHEMAVAATTSTELAEKIAKAVAVESKAMGVYWNYSPVADVNTNHNNPVIGIRSFSDDPNIVTQFVEAYIKGYQSTGIIATAKHFPGHGNTDVDSHLNLPVINDSIDTLMNVHLKPFATAIKNNVKSIMTAHIIVKALDSTNPATFSKNILTDLLRNQMGFNGIVVTDGLNMDAIDEFYNVDEAALNALNAGANVIMATGDYIEQIQILDGLFNALKNNKIDKEMLNNSYNRMMKLKEDTGIIDNPLINYDKAVEACSSIEHKNLSKESFEKSLTLLTNNNTLPIRKNTTLYIAGPYGSKELSESFYKAGFKTYYTDLPNINDMAEGTIKSIVKSIDKYLRDSDYFIFTTYSSEKPPLHKNQVLYANLLKDYNKPLIVVSLGLPYDIINLKFADAFIASYALNRFKEPMTLNKALYDVLVNAVRDIITGKVKAQGVLPVDIPGTIYKKGYHANN
jgi:beta-N-acetylhexosaminidase